MDILLAPLNYEFFRHGLIAATLTGALCGLMGVYIVLRRMSYIGHGLSHAVFGGAVVSALLGWNFFLGAGAWGFLSALLIQGTARRRNIGADAAIGIITTASFALGVALISKTRSFEQNFESALFGFDPAALTREHSPGYDVFQNCQIHERADSLKSTGDTAGRNFVNG